MVQGTSLFGPTTTPKSSACLVGSAADAEAAGSASSTASTAASRTMYGVETTSILRPLCQQPLQNHLHDLGAGAGGVVGGHEVVGHEDRHRQHAAELHLGLVRAEGSVQAAHVVHPPVVHPLEALGHVLVAASPLPHRQLDAHEAAARV